MRPSLALFAAVALVSSGNAAAQSSTAPGPAGLDQSYYFALRGGAYMPQGDAVDEFPGLKFNTGFVGEIALGRRFTPNVAGEIGLGLFWIATGEIAYDERVCDLTSCAYRIDTAERRVTPFVATIKAILPVDAFELYVLGGLGVYFVSYWDTWKTPAIVSESVSKSSSDSPIGLHLGGGATIPLAPKWKLMLDARYVSVKAKATDIWGDTYTTNLGGIGISGGLQFAF